MTALEPLNIVRPLPLRVDDFLLLDANGAFEGYGKTELIEGTVVFMNAQHRPHARIKGKLHLELTRALAELDTGLAVMIEATVAMPPHNAPEPDLLLTREPDGEGPVPLASVALVIEIADTTLSNDLGIKAEVYARGGVPEYWVVDLAGQRVVRMWSAAGDAYVRRDECAFGARVESATIARVGVESGGLN